MKTRHYQSATPEYRRKQRLKAKSKGICVCCLSKKARKNKVKCKRCSNKDALWTKENREKVNLLKKEHYYRDIDKSRADGRKYAAKSAQRKKEEKIKHAQWLRQIDEKIKIGLLKGL